MFDDKRKKQLQELTDQSIRRYKRVVAELSTRTDVPEPGDLYLFPLPADMPLEWVVITIDPDDDDLLYLLPADDHPLVGSADVRIPNDADCAPLVVRCGFGFWVHKEQLLTQRRSGTIPTASVNRANKILSKIVASDLDATSLQKETDCDPEYESWMRELSSAVETLRSSLADAAQPITLLPEVFSHSWYDDSPLDSTPLALAAASAEEDPQTPTESERPVGTILYCDNGVLAALKYKEGIILQFSKPRHHPEDLKPPTILFAESGSETVSWHPEPDWHSSDMITFKDGKAVFRVNNQIYSVPS